MRLFSSVCLVVAASWLCSGPLHSTAPKQPIRWQVKAAPHSALKANAKFAVTITGTLDPGWHLYALEEPSGGPIATVVGIAEGEPLNLIRVESSKPSFRQDTLFHVPTGFFEHIADFILRLQLTSEATPGTHPLRVLIRYQSCNDRVCLPPHTDTVEVPLTLLK